MLKIRLALSIWRAIYNNCGKIYNLFELSTGLNYRLPMKLQEGNGFPRVCLFIGVLPCDIIHDVFDLTEQGSLSPPPPRTSDHQNWDSRGPPSIWHGPPCLSPASDIWWPLLETCSNVFIWGPIPPHQYWHLTSLYGWQAGNTHPTGMLSCFNSMHLQLSYLIHFRSVCI